MELLPQDIRVEFPRNLREQYPIGTRFRADLHVAQKTNGDGSPRGGPYLVANTKTISLETNYKPDLSIFAIKISDRFCKYVEEQRTPEKTDFDLLREAAYQAAKDSPVERHHDSLRRERQKIINKYALERSMGVCEGCDNPAPFITKNETPYLEVRHLLALSRGGADSPINVAAICPNCHRRVDFGKDAESYNALILERITEKEVSMSGL